MAATITNPNDLIDVEGLKYFEEKVSQKYATKEEAGANYATVATCESIIDELI